MSILRRITTNPDIIRSHRLQSRGISIQLCPTDGDCALHAILDQLQHTHHAAASESVQLLRGRIENFLPGVLASISEYQRLDYFQEARVEDERQYVEQMREQGVWLSLPAIQSLAMDLNIQIDVYSPDSLTARQPYAVASLNQAAGRHIIRLLYNGHNHYDSIRNNAHNT